MEEYRKLENAKVVEEFMNAIWKTIAIVLVVFMAVGIAVLLMKTL